MPDVVWFGNFGTVCDVDGQSFRTRFKSFKASVSVKEVDHTGVHDIAEYATIRHMRLKMTIELWTVDQRVAGGATETEKLMNVMDMIGRRVSVTADLADGRAIAGTFNVTGGDLSGDDGAGSSTMTLDSYGPWTVGGNTIGDPDTPRLPRP